MPSLAAERVVFSYGFLESSIPVDSLETFAREGFIDDQLAPYAKEISPEEFKEIQEILLTQVELSHVTLSRFLYSSLGETLLQYLGELIQTDSRLNGFYALRSAVVLAAANPEGLTVLNVLRHFPTQIMHINGMRAFQVAGALTQLLQQTDKMVTLIQQQAEMEAAAATPVDFAQLPDLQQPSSLNWRTETLELYDRSRDPAIEHPGSDTQQLQNLLEGSASEVVDPSEFIDRPKDVSFLLDELERRNQSQASQQAHFNLQQVGVIGHSFGGHTALTLAGAEFDLEQLRVDCAFNHSGLNAVNLSLLL